MRSIVFLDVKLCSLVEMYLKLWRLYVGLYIPEDDMFKFVYGIEKKMKMYLQTRIKVYYEMVSLWVFANQGEEGKMNVQATAS